MKTKILEMNQGGIQEIVKDEFDVDNLLAEAHLRCAKEGRSARRRVASAKEGLPAVART